MSAIRWSVVALVLCAVPAAEARQAAAAAAKPAAPAVANVTVTPVPRDDKWMRRHELINSRAVPREIDVIILGDSITAGWEGGGKAAWSKYFGNRKPMNAGIGGDRTQHVLWQLENGNIRGIAPKVAVLMIGTNNSQQNTPEQITAGIKPIVATLRDTLPTTKVLLLVIFPRGADASDPRRKTNQATNSIVNSLDDGMHIFCLDIGPKFLAADGTLDMKIMPDLLHIIAEGYEIWAAAIDGKLGELLGERK